MMRHTIHPVAAAAIVVLVAGAIGYVYFARTEPTPPPNVRVRSQEEVMREGRAGMMGMKAAIEAANKGAKKTDQDEKKQKGDSPAKSASEKQ